MTRSTFFAALLAATIAGCDNSASPSPSSAGQPTTAAPDTAANKLVDETAEATKNVKVALDSWVFGDSSQKFKQDHPKIIFTDGSRHKQLLRYEINGTRPGKAWTEFAVTLVFASVGGEEIKESRRIDVMSVGDTWGVTSGPPGR